RSEEDRDFPFEAYRRLFAQVLNWRSYLLGAAGRFVSVVWEFRATLHFYFPAGGGRRRGCLLCPADNASQHSSYPWGGRAGRFQRLLDAPRLRSISTRRYPAAAP
ncbi:hypothetical protein, partial [Pseudomonas aeruginosa]|uniref:hypothetical protein n=1 Tax=Pseudomonas aeruginosa TaxID=287 RepID=UPI002554CA2C